MVAPMPDIFESPDGETVYRREFGSTERQVVREGPLRQMMLRSQLWRKIFDAARSDPTLQDMIDKIEIYYRLKHENTDNHGL